MCKLRFNLSAASLFLGFSFALGGNAKAMMVTDTFNITGYNANYAGEIVSLINPLSLNVSVTFDYNPSFIGTVGATEFTLNSTNMPISSYSGPFSFSLDEPTGLVQISEDGIGGYPGNTGAFTADFYLLSPNTARFASMDYVGYNQWPYGTGNGTVTVTNAALNAVPLPPSFALFLTALSCLVLMAYRQRARFTARAMSTLILYQKR